MFGKLRVFDVFPKTLDEFKERTLSGATISLISIVCIVLLVGSEVRYYKQVDRVDELYVDTQTEGKLSIYLNITFPYIACDVLSLDTMDGFGESQADVDHTITKVRKDHQGNVLSAKTESHLGEKGGELELIKRALAVTQQPGYCGSCYGAEETVGQCCNTCDDVRDAYRKRGWAFSIHNSVEQCLRDKLERQIKASADEGCTIYGRLSVNKVQGNFHFAPGKSFQQGGSHIHDFLPFELEHFNVSHQIHRLGFGVEIPGLLNPLDGLTKTVEEGSGMFQYFIKVVPTIFEKLDGETVHSNQYSVTEHFKPRPVGDTEGIIPGVFFVYDLSPIMVHIRETQRHHSVLHFLTNLCSIVGGVFTVAGIIDRMWYSGVRHVQSKLGNGKAG